ncbi:hypothetical protein PHLGIDRAFT_35454 [Phlebiopsis gigantea 11061_1 CR5-6]|uniref:Uncharacterized protein n=1 Tax=Phlebiopsis gigantea (strain 11061_1 CR5-6) TaxID=745531 RepID=A0A0C3RYT9_PHLG1|nr:hypothetical protein PHLGIDRAFT_35454 [Phlebiopsis gigantea 11061_1 CR5-6]
MDDEVVLPSDPEELEEIQAEADLEGYWNAVLPILARNLVRAGYAPAQRTGASVGRAAETRQAKLDDERGRPRKRAKIRHALSDEDIGRVESTLDTYASRRIAGDISNVANEDGVPESHPQAAEAATEDLIEDLQRDGGRYSLRERNPRQIKPYAYDRVLYVRQMRSNPDAIVKFRSPPRRKHDEAQALARKRRKQRFPMNVRRRSKSPDLRLFSQPPSPPPRRIPRKRPRSHVDSSDVEVLPPVAGPSRLRSRSLEREFDQWDVLDDVRFDERMPSPASNPPTSSSVHVSDDFNIDPELNRWESPPRHGSEAMSEVGLSPAREIPIDERPDWPETPPDSDADEDGSQAASLNSEEAEIEERKRYWQLFSMYPTVMARGMIQDNQRQKTAGKSRPPRRSTDPDDGPIKPGQTRVRVGSRRDFALVRGDPESSDAEINVSSRSPSRSSSPPVAGQSFASRLARRSVSRATIYISSDSDSEEDASQEDPDTWTNEPTEWHEASRGIREGTLVDYMLNRTSGRGRKKSNTGTRRTGRAGPAAQRKPTPVQGRGGAPRNRPRQQGSSARSRIAVGGARKYGPKRQSRLSFPRADTAPAASGSGRTVGGDFALDLSVGGPKVAISSTKPAWKRSRNRTIERVYFAAPRVVKVVSGRVMHAHTTTVIEQDAPTIQIMRFPSQARMPTRRPRPQAPLPKRQIVLGKIWQTGEREREGELSDNPRPQARHRNKDNITADMGISRLPSGVSFANDTYLAKGLLYGLLSAQGYIDPPLPGYIGTTRISETTTASEFSSALTEALTEILSQLEHSPTKVAHDTLVEWRRYLHLIPPWTAAFLASVSFDDAETLQSSLLESAQRIYTLASDHFAVKADDSEANLLTLQLQWTAIELIFMVRRAANGAFSLTDDSDLTGHLKLLMQHLLACNVAMKFGSLWPIGFGHLHYGRPLHLVAELWICLIHFVEETGARGAFWTLLNQASQDLTKLRLWSQGLAASEAMWGCMFGFLALSQFSPRGVTTLEVRLPEAWGFVATALREARLKAVPAADAQIPERVLKKRDKYVKLLISRCVWLHSFWNWPLRGAGPMFHSLLSIFTSRGFANLLNEKVADFPAFLKEHKIDLLFSRDEDDSTFTLFLKLLVKAAERTADDARVELPQTLKKYLSLAVPASSVPPSKSSAASPHELSMLYNRFSAIAVAIYLEPTPDNAKARVNQASKYVEDFDKADQSTRQACIRAVMYLMILLQHLNLPLDGAREWLEKITCRLIDEFTAVQHDHAEQRQKNGIVKMIQMILACVRRVIETPCMDSAANKAPQYPSTALLEGPWVKRIFVLQKTSIANTLNTTLEMRMLVQAFLKARNAVLPRPSIRHAHPVAQEESQEDYGDFGFNLDDPAVAAALGIGDTDTGDPRLRTQEEETCKVLDEYISKAVFRVLCAHLSSSRQEPDQHEIDKWLECWVGCAEVLVRNGRRNWATYFGQASQTLSRMPLGCLKLRRINLSLALSVLKHDASSYSTQQDHFLRTLFECIITSRIELEAEYVALLFTIDDMQHPLFRGIPAPEMDEAGHYQLTRAELVERRLSYVEHMLGNVEHCLSVDAGFNPATSERNQQYVGYTLSMLSEMRTIFESLDVPGQAIYTPFCSKVLGLISQNVQLRHHERLRDLLDWMRTL